jgi:transcriptional regulator with XRE-family HTH domain
MGYGGATRRADEGVPSIEKIDARRAAAGLSIAALCARAGVHPTTYWRWQRRGVEGNLRTLTRLATALEALDVAAAAAGGEGAP